MIVLKFGEKRDFLGGGGGRVGLVRLFFFGIGLGSRVQFWHDCWCEVQLLKVIFLILFENATNR